MNSITSELDKIAEEIQPQNPVIALAIDKISDHLDANLELLSEDGDGDLKKFIEEKIHEAKPYLEKMETDLGDAWEILKHVWKQGLDPNAKYQAPSERGLGSLYNKFKSLRENFEILNKKIEEGKKLFHSHKEAEKFRVLPDWMRKSLLQDEETLAYLRSLNKTQESMAREISEALKFIKTAPQGNFEKVKEGIVDKIMRVKEKLDEMVEKRKSHPQLLKKATGNPMLMELSVQRLENYVKNLLDWTEDIKDEGLKNHIRSNLNSVDKEIKNIKQELLTLKTRD